MLNFNNMKNNKLNIINKQNIKQNNLFFKFIL